MEEFFGEKLGGNLIGYKQEVVFVVGYSENIEMAMGIKEEAFYLGFSVIDKLYFCQCGKSFTYKSQRDRYMSMYFGFRSYGCSVCGKKFKMKYYFVGYMKIYIGIKFYECNICVKRFMWRDSFYRYVIFCIKFYEVVKVEQNIIEVN